MSGTSIIAKFSMSLSVYTVCKSGHFQIFKFKWSIAIKLTGRILKKL